MRWPLRVVLFAAIVAIFTAPPAAAALLGSCWPLLLLQHGGGGEAGADDETTVSSMRSRFGSDMLESSSIPHSSSNDLNGLAVLEDKDEEAWPLNRG